jgi:hypothetical protein
MRLYEFIDETAIKLSGSSDKAKAWIKKVYDLYPQTWQNNHVMPMGGSGDDQQFAMFELEPSFSKRGAVEVKWFQAYPLRQGVGSRAMKELQRMAQEDGIALTLYPWDKGQVSQSKLTKFYKGQGFKPTTKGAKNMAWNPVEEGREEALHFATQAHAGQTRAGGAPYISHPVRVAQHVEQWKKSHNIEALISAAYLHDTLEDTDTTHEALQDLFGGLVASLVQELTSDPEEIKKVGKAAYLAHKMAAMSSYALVIKLADRLDNVKDITTAKTPEWRTKYKAETEHILSYIEKNRALSGTHQKLIGLIRNKLQELNESKISPNQKCPPATQDIKINLENRQKAINEYGYGPLNPDLPNNKFWQAKVDEWNLDSPDEAKQSLCGNCAAFDQRQATLNCIAQGIDSDTPQDAKVVIDAGDLGYCKFLKFKCASRRTCDAWVTGGPLTDNVDENFDDGKNPGRKGLSQRVGIPKNATISQLEKHAKASGEEGRMARWQLNMRRGRNK